ncbi:glycosyltransferase family 2 protein [Actibacterium sp. 188UL27-1]|uniref:glycosyltransferase family 2 protein n=1 Tax=Actibacterium sp. 188UL27-1 TaxID=2786961 RepID=UPI001959FE95|nr:glycosyltransferase family 2 protein [Actibacterium sp. 188UL27-1]
MTEPKPDLTVIVISYNTRELTLAALRTLYETTRKTNFKTVVLDNASHDGSADAVAEHFPQVELIRSNENLGFAKANNVVAADATTEWLLLLNPDTECHEGAVDNLMAFAKANPQAGIYGGRTVFPDGSLNIASCWQKITVWSNFAKAIGLAAMFKGSEFFNPEGMGDWKRDTVREVDIVVGCFLLIPRALWDDLGGFDLKYFMYGEEADLCLRAKAKGYSPMITPDAEIMHIFGAAESVNGEKATRVAKARTTLIRDHCKPFAAPFGVFTMWLWSAIRHYGLSTAARLNPGKFAHRAEQWGVVWAKRRDWLKGY